MLYESPDAPEPSSYMEVVLARPSSGGSSSGSSKAVVDYGVAVAKALFYEDVKRRKDAGVYKTAVKVPTPLDFDHDSKSSGGGSSSTTSTTTTPSYTDLSKAPSRLREKGWEQKVWSQTDSLREFLEAVVVMFTDKERVTQLGSFDFDKDDGE